MGGPPALNPRSIRFGVYEFDFYTRELRRNGIKLKIAGQPVEVLAILLERPGELITREELQGRLWPHDTVVEFEHSINTAIKRVREVLDDLPSDPRYVETLPRRGYRFIAAVEVVPPIPPPPWQPAAVGGGSPPGVSDSEITGQMVGRYRVKEKLGGGGMGIVYQAEDTKLGRAVAIKFLPMELATDRKALERFEREARAASALDHPNICTVHDIGEHFGQPYLVMQLLKGQTLKQMLTKEALARTPSEARKGPLPPDILVHLALQVLDGLAAAHSKGIIHRDIKPTNIFVTESGQAKILDFGLAKLQSQREGTRQLAQQADTPTSPTVSIDDSITKTGVAMGTPAYMSPEQVRGEEIDTRTDLFSFGATLYEMATGIQPFGGSTPVEVQQAILLRTPTGSGELNHQLPAQLAPVITKALGKDREKRYQSATDLRADLAAVRDELKPVSGHPWWSNRTKRWSAVIGGITLAVIFVAALLIGLNIGRLRERWRGTSVPKIESIAVLPLENLSGDPNREYFADGMTEELISTLGKISALRVVSRTSVMRYKGARPQGGIREIAKQLNVDAVIEGSVMRSGDRVKVTVQLIHATTDRHLWSESYQTDLRNVPSLQDDVARAVADRAKIKLAPHEQIRLTRSHPIDPRAHEAYMLGYYHTYKHVQEEIPGQKSLDYFQQAIEIDPEYAAAYAGLARIYIYMAYNSIIPPAEAFLKARIAIGKAVELDEELSEGHAALGEIKYTFEWDWAGAERELRRAIELNQSSRVAHEYYAYYLTIVGRFDEALEERKRAFQLEPFNRLGFVWTYALARRYKQALLELQKESEINGASYQALAFFPIIYQANGMNAEALAACTGLRELYPGPIADAACGYVHGEQGNIPELHKTLARYLKSPLPDPWLLSGFYEYLGERDKAVEALNTAYEQRNPNLCLLKVDPTSASEALRSDPRVQAILRRMNFPE